MEKTCLKYQSDQIALAQHGRRNNVILSRISESVSEDILEESVISVLADIDVLIESQNIEACYKFGKGDKSQKTIVHFENRKNCNKVFNKKNLCSIDNSKHIFMQNTKIFANENLTPMNESIAYNRLIHGCFLRDGIVRINRREKDRRVKIFHIDKLHGLFPDFDFGVADDEYDIFLDASQVVNDSVQ